MLSQIGRFWANRVFWRRYFPKDGTLSRIGSGTVLGFGPERKDSCKGEREGVFCLLWGEPGRQQGRSAGFSAGLVGWKKGCFTIIVALAPLVKRPKKYAGDVCNRLGKGCFAIVVALAPLVKRPKRCAGDVCNRLGKSASRYLLSGLGCRLRGEGVGRCSLFAMDEVREHQETGGSERSIGEEAGCGGSLPGPAWNQ